MKSGLNKKVILSILCCLVVATNVSYGRDLIGESRARQKILRESIEKNNQNNTVVQPKNQKTISPPINTYTFDSLYSPYFDEYQFAFGTPTLNHQLFVDSNTYDASLRTNVYASKSFGFYHRYFFTPHHTDIGLTLGNFDENKKYDLIVDFSLVDMKPAFLFKTPIGILGPMSFQTKQDWQDIRHGLKLDIADYILLKDTQAPQKPLKRVAEHLTAKVVAKFILGRGFLPVIAVKRIFRWLHVF